MRELSMYTLLLVVSLGIFFGMLLMIEENFGKADKWDTYGLKTPKWKIIIGFWCWALYLIAYPILRDGHPWKNGRVGLKNFTGNGTKLFFEFGAMFWYGFLSIAAIIYVLIEKNT